MQEYIELSVGALVFRAILVHMESSRPLFFMEATDLPESCVRVDATRNFSVKESGTANTSAMKSAWVFYPWRNTAVLMPDEDAYFALRTSRNRDLITQAEQRDYRSASIGIAGLSVGSAALEFIVATGGPKRLRIADPDIIEISNLNRIKATLSDVGQNKCVVAARRVWEIDPFAELQTYPEGVSQESMREFLSGLTLVIDEMDNIPLKFALRETAREMGIPVIMGTDNGDSAIIDIERFDLEPDRPLFHGRVDSSTNVDPKTKAEFSALAAQIIDPSMFTERQFESVRRVGIDLAGVPQLATAASIAGAGVAYAARMIATKGDIASGRYALGCDLGFEKPLT